jgi:hypothetical protein
VSTFASILQRAVEATPGAIGGAFAAPDGELVDSFRPIASPAKHRGELIAQPRDDDQLAILAAHYGIVLAQLDSAFGTWHYGGPEYFIVQSTQLDVVVHAVDNGYYALLAITEPAPLAIALVSMRTAVGELRREMA